MTGGRWAVAGVAALLVGGCQLLDGSSSSPPAGRAPGWVPPGSVEAGTATAQDAGQSGEASLPAPVAEASTPAEAGAITGIDASLPDLRPAIAVAAGYEHSCALSRAGAVWCWGASGSGQLGSGSTVSSAVPLPVAGLDGPAVALSAGGDHTCAIVAAEAGDYVECWGRNDDGQLGDGTTTDRPSAVRVAGLPAGVSAVAAGGLHTCAIAGGDVWCWGDDADGQLGDGSTQDRPAPAMVAGIAGATAIAAGGAHSCAVSPGAVRCWGFGQDGQLGAGTDTSSGAPQTVQGLAGDVTCVCAGNAHTCALTAAGATCWGYGQYGQLGDGNTTDALAPTPVQALAAGATTMVAGAEHVCALDAAGGAWCWGENESGQLGNGASSDSPVPVSVQGIATGAVAIAAGEAHSCAVVAGGGIQCWGWNVTGQLGNGSAADSPAPVEVAGF
jgi:alpha-tubulin suppressor-like RCC1 family protein